MNDKKYKLIRVTTVAMSLNVLLKGQFRFFQNNGFEVICVSSDSSDLYSVGVNEGVNVRSIEMTRRISPFYDFVSLWRMYNFIKDIRPDIVHSHTPKAGIVSMLASKMAGVPLRIHTVAGLPLMESNGVKRFLLKAVEFLTYACSTHVFPNSFGLRNFILKERLVSESKVKVLGNGSSNGVDTTYFSASSVSLSDIEDIRNKLEIKESDFVFLFVGRLVTDKGINELVDAFLSVADLEKYKGKSNIKLLLVGSFERELDPLSDKTLTIISQNDSIIVTGFVADVRPYFLVSDCLVFPSYREGFPNVVLQAGSMGLPSIVSDINGCNEIITDGLNGIIVPPKDVDSLLIAMKRICLDQQLRSKLGLEARRIIETRYEQNVLWNLLKAEYLILLGSSDKH
jgi:glycosyltransferase involved in cell wall biosynthesis